MTRVEFSYEVVDLDNNCVGDVFYTDIAGAREFFKALGKPAGYTIALVTRRTVVERIVERRF